MKTHGRTPCAPTVEDAASRGARASKGAVREEIALECEVGAAK